MNEIVSTRYDRLRMFYQNLMEDPNEFYPITYKGYRLYPPLEVKPDKNSYRKYIRVPMKRGNTKQYFITLYNRLYRLYKSNNNFFFINCGEGTPKEVKEYGFGTSMLYSYIAMSIYELIIWLTGPRNKYKIKIDDQVFNPIFDFPQWSYDDYDAYIRLTMYPMEKENNNKLIALSIYN